VSEPHTPGPWQYLKGSSETGIDGMLYTVGDPYGHGSMHVADVTVRGWGHMTGVGGGLAWPVPRAAEVQAANARLIAAAPDLLAALYAVKHAFEGTADQSDEAAIQNAYKRACWTIDKAEGK
jgi:hypothetical protein